MPGAATVPAIKVREFLLALIADLPMDKNYEPRFRGAHRDVHVFFWRLKQQTDTQSFVEELLFDTNGIYPHCEQIDEFLQELQVSGLLVRPNPTYRFNDINITDAPYSAAFTKNLSPELQSIYGRIVKDFRECLGVLASKRDIT